MTMNIAPTAEWMESYREEMQAWAAKTIKRGIKAGKSEDQIFKQLMKRLVGFDEEEIRGSLKKMMAIA